MSGEALPYYISSAGEPEEFLGGPSTPNGQPIHALEVGRRLYVHTASCVYYLRRNKLRLWRRT